MKKGKSKGITLIALIITIIVMLILVGVTVSVALNGGLFTTAKEAANRTQEEIDIEILSSVAWSTIGENGEVNFTTLDENLPEGFKGSNGIYTKDGNTFKVDKHGGVTIKEPSTGDLAILEKYFLGENGEGKDILSLIDNINDINDYTDCIFKDDSNSIPNAKEDLVLCLIDSNTMEEVFYYVIFNGNCYKLYVEETNMGEAICRDIELIYGKEGREGQIVKYDSNNDGTVEDWMILYDNGDNVEIVSMEAMGSLTLGYNDEETQGSIDIEKAIYSYNNAIARLNNYCVSLITNENKISVRSVGSDPDNPSIENSTLYRSENLAKWEDGRYNGVGKSEDRNYEQDQIRMMYYNCINTDTKYWVASRMILETDYGISFCIRNVYYMRNSLVNADDYNYCLDTINKNNVVSFRALSYSYAVRPIVKLSSDLV